MILWENQTVLFSCDWFSLRADWLQITFSLFFNAVQIFPQLYDVILLVSENKSLMDAENIQDVWETV